VNQKMRYLHQPESQVERGRQDAQMTKEVFRQVQDLCGRNKDRLQLVLNYTRRNFSHG